MKLEINDRIPVELRSVLTALGRQSARQAEDWKRMAERYAEKGNFEAVKDLKASSQQAVNEAIRFFKAAGE